MKIFLSLVTDDYYFYNNRKGDLQKISDIDTIPELLDFDNSELDGLLINRINENNILKNNKMLDFLKVICDKNIPIYINGIKSIKEIEYLFNIGIKKIIININNLNLIKKAIDIFGKEHIIVLLEVKNIGEEYFILKNEKNDIEKMLKNIENMGIEEIILKSIDREGTGSGYDINLIKKISYNTPLKIIALGGMGKIEDIMEGFEVGADSLAFNNFFHFIGFKGIKKINKYIKNKEKYRFWEFD